MEPLERKMQEIPSSENVSTKLERIAKLAKQMPGVALTSLSHHIDLDWLREAYRRTRKDGATGVDGQTAGRIRRESGGKSPVAARPCEVRDVSSAARAAGPDSKGGRKADAPHRHPDVRG